MRWEPSDGEGRWSASEADESSYHLAGWSVEGNLLYRVKIWSLSSKSVWAALSSPWLRLRTERCYPAKSWPANKLCVIIRRVYLQYIHMLQVGSFLFLKLIYPLPNSFSTTTLVLLQNIQNGSAKGTWKNARMNFYIRVYFPDLNLL